MARLSEKRFYEYFAGNSNTSFRKTELLSEDTKLTAAALDGMFTNSPYDIFLKKIQEESKITLGEVSKEYQKGFRYALASGYIERADQPLRKILKQSKQVQMAKYSIEEVRGANILLELAEAKRRTVPDQVFGLTLLENELVLDRIEDFVRSELKSGNWNYWYIWESQIEKN